MRSDGRLAAPEIAVVITCRNYENFVGDAIVSVARQTYRLLRCVIVDDASTDRSRFVIERVLNEINDSRFSLLPLSENVGQLRAFQLALADTPGQFVAFLDADDFWFPSFLECHARAHLNASRSAPISGSDAVIVDGQDRVVEGTFATLTKQRSNVNELSEYEIPQDACPAIEQGFVFAGDGQPMDLLYLPRPRLLWHWVNTSAMVFRRDFIDVALPPDGKPRERHADYYLAYLAQILGGTLILPQALGVYRAHRKNLFANLPRIGGGQITGTEPAGAMRETHEFIVLHIMRNWPLFESLVGPEALVFGLRHFVPWRELDGLAARNGIRPETRAAVRRGLRALRLDSKRGIERFAVKYLGL